MKAINLCNPDFVNLYDCEIGEGTKIGAFVEIGGSTIGANCKIQSFVFIPPGVTIGDNVFIGPHVCFMNVKKPDLSKKPEFLKTTVGDNAVIGAGARILPGIIIEDSAFVAAGSVVTKNVRSGARVKGNPAKEF